MRKKSWRWVTVCLLMLALSCRKDDTTFQHIPSTPVEINELQVSRVDANNLAIRAEMFLTAPVQNSANLKLEISIDDLKITKDIPLNSAVPGELFTISFPLDNSDHHIANRFAVNYCKVQLDGTSRDLLPRPFRILINESIGRLPDMGESFIVYQDGQTSIGASNSDPGLSKKISSFTEFSPRDSSPNAILAFKGALWIFGGWDQNPDESFSSKANIWRSEDSINWTLVNPAPPFTHYSNFIVYKDQILIYTEYNTLLTTVDGITFQQQQLPSDVHFSESNIIVFNDELYLIYLNTIGHSKDGIQWTFEKTPFPGAPRKGPGLIAFKGKLYFFGGATDYNDYATYYNDIYMSEDGVQWTKLVDKAEWTPRYWFNYTVLNGKLWIINGWAPFGQDSEYGNFAEAWSTEDGVNWQRTQLMMPARHASFGVHFKNQYLLLAGFGSRFPTRMYNDVWVFGTQ